MLILWSESVSIKKLLTLGKRLEGQVSILLVSLLPTSQSPRNSFDHYVELHFSTICYPSGNILILSQDCDENIK